MPRDDNKSPPPDSEREEREQPGCNLYIANLSYRTTDEQLQSFFGKHGTLKSCKIIKDPTDNRSRGFGFVSYSTKEEADKVAETLATCELDGRTIRVEKARRNKPYPATPGRYLGQSYRKDGTGNVDRRRHSRSPSPRYRSRSPRRRSFSRSPPRRSRYSRSPRR